MYTLIFNILQAFSWEMQAKGDKSLLINLLLLKKECLALIARHSFFNLFCFELFFDCSLCRSNLCLLFNEL